MSSPPFAPERPGLHAELYQLVQAAVYHGDGLWGEASFDLFLRDLPPDHGYAIAAGIEPAIDDVLAMRFGSEEVAWLQGLPMFRRASPHFFESLRNFSFAGTIRAVPEGTPVFPGQPIMTVTAPLTQVGLVETRLLQRVGHATAVATRASRICAAAHGRAIIDFAARRCADSRAAMDLARAAYIGGCAATTYGAAAARFGIPGWAVISESLAAAYGNELAAIAALRLHFPGHCHVNLPGMNITRGPRQLAVMKDDVRTVRLVHDNLAGGSRQLRLELDRVGMHRTRILGSGSLDEHQIADLVRAGAPLAMFGVGGSLATAATDVRPSLSYRMAEITRGLEPMPVTGAGGAAWPGLKQIVRLPDRDLLCLEAEHLAHAYPDATELLTTAVSGGERVREAPGLDDIRRHCDVHLDALPVEVRRLRKPGAWRIQPSDVLAELAVRG